MHDGMPAARTLAESITLALRQIQHEQDVQRPTPRTPPPEHIHFGMPQEWVPDTPDE